MKTTRYYIIIITLVVGVFLSACELSMYHVDTKARFLSITDRGSDIQLMWKTNIKPSQNYHYNLGIESDSDQYNIGGNVNEMEIARKVEYYGKLFSLSVVTDSGVVIDSISERYSNDYSLFFNGENKSIAHRGLSSLYPENTMIAFENAYEHGFVYVECDLRLTKDKIWVLLHDDSISRTSNGSGLVKDYTLEELEAFDFGYPDKFGNLYPQQILTLKDFISFCRQKGLRPIFEIKPNYLSDDDIKSFYKDVSVIDCDEYAISCFQTKILTDIRKLSPRVNLGFPATDYSPDHVQILDSLYPCFYILNVNAIDCYQDVNDTSNVQVYQLSKKGIMICLWTIYDPICISNMLDKGFFVYTDILPSLKNAK